MIKVNGLDKYFNRHKNNEIHVIDNTTVEFGDTGLVCVLGESGSGKTTLLNTMGGLDSFASGTITVDDMELDGYKASKIEMLRNRKFGYIFQNYYLLQDATVEYNLRLALNIFDISDDEVAARIQYVLEAVDMYNCRKKLVSELSGGQRQRVAIARALAKAPDIIFADEPTGNLDENNTMRVMSIIKKISAKCLVILVTHERRIAEFFADRIIEVADGRIVSDRENQGSKTYVKADDTNIYLQDYLCKTVAVNDININVYSDGSESTISLNLVFKDGRLYVQSTDDNRTVFVTGESEMRLIDDKQPQIGIEEIEEFDYNLEQVKLKKRPHLKFKETMSIALSNVRSMGKKQAFIFVTFIITAVLLTLSVADYYSMRRIDKKSFITEDSHYVTVSYYEVEGNIPQADKVLNEFFESGIDGQVSAATNIMMYISSKKYAQYSNTKFTYSGFGYVDYDKLNEEDIIYGRLPENDKEIVVDKMFYDMLDESDSFLKPIVNDYDDLLELTVHVGFNSGPMRICGVADTGEMSVYVDKLLMINVSNQAYKMGFLSQLQEAYPGQYDDIELESDMAIINQSYFDGYIYNQIAGSLAYNEFNLYSYSEGFPSDFDADFVIDEESYSKFVYNLSLRNRKVKIYSNEPEKVVDFFESRSEHFQDEYGINVVVTYTYGHEMEEYMDDLKSDIYARNIVTGAIFILSLIIFFFIMKTNAINRTEELVVYRLMGISPRSITMSYIMEIVIMVSYTQLPTIIVSCGILKYLSGIKNLGFATECPLYLMCLLIVFCYIVNLIIGLIPICRIVKLPPAKLAAKNN